MSRVIQGYCLRPHTETVGKSGIEKRWTEDELRKAAPTLAGSPVTKNASKTVESVIGEVKYAEYVDGEGVRYEAEIHDEQCIEMIESGLVEPAPRMKHDVPDLDDHQDVVEPEGVEFDSLFLTDQPCESVPPLGRPGMDRKI